MMVVVICCSVPDDYKANPGAVETLAQHPKENDKILIGYNRGLIVLWNRTSLSADQVNNTRSLLGATLQVLEITGLFSNKFS